VAARLQHARTQLLQDAGHKSLHASAELSYLAAQESAKRDWELAAELYFDAAQFSWQYLFQPDSGGQLPEPNSAQHRETTEVYNASVEQLLRLFRQNGQHDLTQAIVMPLTRRSIVFDLPFPSAWLSTGQLGGYEFVSDYQLSNLRNCHVGQGVGVPIIATRKRPEGNQPLERYYADGMRFPATVVMSFPEGGSYYGDSQPVRMQLFDPRESSYVTVRNVSLPLEIDLSTPLARFLTNPDMKLLDTFGLIRPDRAKKLQGLYMVQPYDPDRIPVLMVHGLWSSPVTWMEMFNDLQSDPDIRDKYQFWFYMYPTGEPLTFAAADLRDDLEEVRLACDPRGENRKLDQMVMVGHSMGGLMSYLLTVDSDDRLWNAMSKLSIDEIQTDTDTRNDIKRVFFFESDSSVDRIVTIASPFGGSGYANVFTRWLSGNVIWLPGKTSRLSDLIFRQNHQSLWDRMFAPRTSLDSLNKDSAVLRLVAQTKVPDEVEHHNIVGVNGAKSRRRQTDGVVRYGSAHREDADSEVVVEASHSSVHRHPETISEVRRVLLEHLKDVNRRQFRVVPIGHEAETDATEAVPALVP
jgi:pimeloyl-ACP methyl ester carboxylesterase